MKKKYAIALFGGVTKMAVALKMSRQAIHRMPVELSQGQEDRVVGACQRLGITQPPTHDYSGPGGKDWLGCGEMK